MEWNIFREAYTERKPLQASLEVILSCNLRCKHCYQYPHNLTSGLYLPFSQWKKIIDSINEAGVVFTEVTGGEPFFHPEIFKILEYLREKNFLVTIITNGTLLNEDKINRLKDLKIVTLYFSLYGATAETHDRVTGVEGSFKKLISSIDLALEKGIKVVLKTSIGKDNYFELEQLIAFSKARSLPLQIGFLILPNQEGEIIDFSLSLDENEDVFQRIFAYNKEESGVEVLLNPESPRGDCGALKVSFAINYNGDVEPCPGIGYKIGNILEMPDFSKIWYNKNAEDFLTRSFAKKCMKCEYYHKCQPCSYFILHGQERFLCDVYEKVKRKL